MKFRLLAAAALSMMVAAGSANAATNFVSDGNFATPSATGAFTTYKAGKTIGPWQVLSGSVDLIGSYWNPPSAGGQSVDLDGNNPGEILQYLTFAHSGSYLLTFSLSANPDAQIYKINGFSPTKDVSVSVGDQKDVGFAYTVPSSPTHTLGYEVETLRFVIAPGAGPITDALIFQSLDKSNSAYGPVIGDVSITAVPEPATWAMMLIGFGGLGAALRMNRRRSLVAA